MALSDRPDASRPPEVTHRRQSRVSFSLATGLTLDMLPSTEIEAKPSVSVSTQLAGAVAAHKRFEELLINLASEHEYVWKLVEVATQGAQVSKDKAGQLDAYSQLKGIRPDEPHTPRSPPHSPCPSSPQISEDNWSASDSFPANGHAPINDSTFSSTTDVVKRESLQFMATESENKGITGTDSKASHLNSLPASVVTRLRGRLGILEYDGEVTSKALFSALTSLGLDTYSEKEINKLLMRLVVVHRRKIDEEEVLRELTSIEGEKRSFFRQASNVATKLGSLGMVSMPRTISSLSDHPEKESKLTFQMLMRFFLSETARNHLGPVFKEKLLVIKEVLLSGDANRLVAELTQVRIDQLASPVAPTEWGYILEPLVGAVILTNGVVIGLQTDENLDAWDYWFWVDLAFTLFYILEICVRIRVSGCRAFFLGPERAWSFFDTLLVVTAICETVLHVCFDVDSNVALIRVIRLGRLMRLVRLLRSKFFKELSIMIKGLLAGVRTLCWALVLLFFTVYILAVVTTYTIGKDPRNVVIANEELFNSVPRAMLTLFRCFVGDCTTSHGEPIVKLVSDAHGILFILGYIGSVTAVTLGLFNLIMALYVDITMAAARRTEETSANRRQRESLRVARITKELLKKMCVLQNTAQQVSHAHSDMERSVSQSSKHVDHQNQDMDADMVVSRDDFLLIIQDQDVQRLMNELDIPPDRASLFEVLDADGTGDLHVTELVHGLLKIRGDARKSDIVAVLLAVRAVQEMIRAIEDKMDRHQNTFTDHFGMAKRVSGKRSIWDRLGHLGQAKTLSRQFEPDESM